MSYGLNRVVAVLVLGLIAMSVTEAAAARARRGGGNQAVQQDAGLNRKTVAALKTALDDERRSKAYYTAVVRKYGQVMPFAHIVFSEGCHESALLSLMKKYDVEAPADSRDATTMEVPATLQAARERAIQFERENIAMYDRLLKAVRQEDIRAVMTRLRNMSAERHLPAFERFSQGGGQGPAGMGRGMGRGMGGMGRGGMGGGMGMGGMGGCCGMGPCGGGMGAGPAAPGGAAKPGDASGGKQENAAHDAAGHR